MNTNAVDKDNYAKKPWKDYNNYDYQEYWDSKVRLYEDIVERFALRQILPTGQNRIVDLGANYGRLADEYHQFSQVVLVDGAFTAIRQAREKWEKHGIQCGVCDIRTVPFPSETFDVVACIRTLHHQIEVDVVFSEANRILKKGGIFIFSFANKSNLKHQFLSVFGLSSRQVRELNPTQIGINVYNFHPEHIEATLDKYRFQKESSLGVGIFRHKILAGLIPPNGLAKIESFLQNRLSIYKLSPSVFVKARKV